MRRLSPRVNVIPVVGRADSLTPLELKDFKRRIMEDIEHYNIRIYNFPYDVEEDDEDTIEENSELRVSLSCIFFSCWSLTTCVFRLFCPSLSLVVMRRSP